MVRFCPRCGSSMLPVRKGKTLYLRCTRCGYEIKADEKDARTYGVKYEVEREKRTATARISGGGQASLSEEDREMMQEYYEVFLEAFRETEEGEEEE